MTSGSRPASEPAPAQSPTHSPYSGGVNATSSAADPARPDGPTPGSSTHPTDAGRGGLSDLAAAALVFFASAAVLVVELVALRLLAPHLGLTLETNTLVIGIALGAIALGSWAGGRAADVVDPRSTLAPLLAVSAVAVAATPTIVRAVAALENSTLLLLAAGATIIVPGALLSAVTPMVTKLSLTSLAVTGSVVGRLSSIGTAGSIVGTVVTGFVLISRVPVSGILVGLGVALLAAALLVVVGLRPSTRPSGRAVAGCAVLVAASGLAAGIVPDGCDVETTYHCAAVVTDPENPSGRILMLDGLRHSYVDLDDDENLHFRYVQSIAAAVDSRFDAGRALQAHHIGGGGLTMPRYLASTRPGSMSTVSEIDPGVVRLDQEVLGAELGDDLQVRVEDGRLGLASLEPGSRDLVIGDAFGGVSVPWHLTTRETVGQVAAALNPEGIYALNVIDRGPKDFARAEVATVAGAFEHVAVASTPEALTGDGGGNLVVLASNSPLDIPAWKKAMDARDIGWDVIDGDPLRTWTAGAPVLTDDYSPVDQLLTAY